MPTTLDAITHSLSRAWERTAGLLWRPFDARTWFVLAFAQFLASLPPDSWGGGVSGPGSSQDWSGALDRVESAWARLAAGGVLVALVVIGLGLLMIVLIALLWVGSRAKFVFLDDVVHGRARIVEPWNRFSREGNSLFLFNIALFFIVCFLIAVVLVTVASSVGIGALLRGQPFKIGVLAFFVFTFVGILSVVLGYAFFFLGAFVVPIMHRYRLGAIDAWGRFLALFRARPLPFLAVGLAVIVAFTVFGISIVMFGFMTCCIGFILLMTPYLSNVLLLPFTVLYRAFTVEFLAQFDPDLLPGPDTLPPSPA